jgi:hypothetical protein
MGHNTRNSIETGLQPLLSERRKVEKQIPRGLKPARDDKEISTLSARLNRLLKKSEKQIPRGLKSARDDKNKGLGRGPEGPLYPSNASNRVFQQPLEVVP